MARSPGRWLLTASLISVLSAATPALAQAERPWVDPPPENGAAPSSTPAPAPAVQPPQAPAPAVARPSSASAPSEVPKEKEAVAAQSPAEVAPRKEKADAGAKQKTVTERKVRPPAQQARSVTRSQKRERLATRRREPGSEVSEARPPRNGIERRARATRYGSVQEGIDAGLEVMRLRTIQLPDGRRIEVLTRPNQDIAGGLPDGY